MPRRMNFAVQLHVDQDTLHGHASRMALEQYVSVIARDMAPRARRLSERLHEARFRVWQRRLAGTRVAVGHEYGRIEPGPPAPSSATEFVGHLTTPEIASHG